MAESDARPLTPPPPLRWREVRRWIRGDRERLERLCGEKAGLLHPGFLCVVLYRVSHYFLRSGHRYLARLVWHLNTVITGADISPPSEIGEGLVIFSPAGIAFSGKAGRNLTLMGLAGAGSELGRREDIGAGPGLPILGDDVVIEPNAGVMGPVRIGDRVRIGAITAVTRDIPDDMIVKGPPAQAVRRRDRP